jgi:hypothetical protein
MTQWSKTRQVFNCVCLMLLSLLLLAGAAWGQSTTIYATNFGMQCGTGVMSNCPGYTLPTGPAQPGAFRLWDSGTYWAVLQPPAADFGNCLDIQQVAGVDTYCWDNLDSWLNAIAGSTTIKAVIYTFGGVPCELVNEGNGMGADCNTGPGDDKNGLAYPPNDLNAGGVTGSASFNSFVNNLTQHCSPSPGLNCVGKCTLTSCAKTNLIQYYEMWNEPNGQFWNPGGNETQLENMVFPAVSYIRANVTNPVVLTPGFAGANTDYPTWFENWLNAETAAGTTYGTLSNDVAFHVYFPNVTPETQYSCYIAAATSSSTCSSNSGLASFLYIKDTLVTGWASKPWINTETNYSSAFVCPTEDTDTNQATTAADCAGQVVRWQLLLDASGATSVDWYFWNTTIGNPPTMTTNPYYDGGLDADNPTAYYWMMQYLEGGKFSQTCNNTSTTNTSIWTCKFTDTNGNGDLWVWTTNTTPQAYTPPTGANDYWIVSATTATCTTIPSGFTVTVEPYLLVKSCAQQP